MKNLLIGILLCFALQVAPVRALAMEPQELTIEQDVETHERMNFFEELYYRFFEKEEKDFFDYVLLGMLIIGLLIVMVLQNTHTYVREVKREEVEFLERDNELDVIAAMEFEKERDHEVEAKVESIEDKEENEELSSDELEVDDD